MGTTGTWAVVRGGAFGALLLLLAAPLGAVPEARPVIAQPLSALMVLPERSASATCLSLNDSRISTEVAGTVSEIPIKVGDTVKRGDVIARLDNKDYRLDVAREQAALQSVVASLSLAEYELERAVSLREKQAVSEEHLRQRQADVDRLRAEHEAREAVLARAKRDLKRAEVHAPFKGVVLERLGRVGELAGPGTPLIRLLDLEQVEVSAPIRPGDAPSLASAQSIDFVADGRRYPLHLRVITPAVNGRERTREARFVFATEMALPGTPGRVVWREATPHLPAHLIVRRGDQLGVFLFDQGHARFLPLKGAQEGRPAPVQLAADALIVTEGRFTLQDGDPVKRQ